MKRKQVDAILALQAKRRLRIFISLTTTTLLILFTILFSLRYMYASQKIEVSYNEESNTTYEVHLKDNVFFDSEFLQDQNKYVASLIDYVNATFNYKIQIDDTNVNYNYSYKVDAVVTVKEGDNGKPLFTKVTNLIKETDRIGHSKDTVHVLEKLKVDYNIYNDLAKRFVNVYGLENTTSILQLNMYVNVVGNCEDFEGESNNQSVITIEMPLNTKTLDIVYKDSIAEVPNKILICDKTDKTKQIANLLKALGTIILTIICIIDLIKYIKKTRTAEGIYDRNLKKILNSYHSYIQKVNNEFDMDNLSSIDKTNSYKNCQVFKLETFTDLLEIRDSLNTPILMFSNKSNTATQFVILNIPNKAIYVYEIKVEEKKNN